MLQYSVVVVCTRYRVMADHSQYTASVSNITVNDLGCADDTVISTETIRLLT